MKNFNYLSPTEFVFGKQIIEGIGAKVKEYGQKVLLHYGGGHIKKTGLYDAVTDSLKKEGLTVIELGGVKANPDVELVREGIKLCKDNNIDIILAVGGGSVIDSAKGIGMGVFYDGDVWDLYIKKPRLKRCSPWE